MKRNSKKQQRLDAELGLIIEEMSRAMWNANREYIAHIYSTSDITINMRIALNKFIAFCQEHYEK